MDYYTGPSKYRPLGRDRFWWWNALVAVGSLALGIVIIISLIFFFAGPIELQDQTPSMFGFQRQPRPLISGADILKSIVPATLGLLLISMLTMHLRTLRRSHARIVLNHLTAAVRLRLPLPAYLLASAGSEPRGVRRRLVRLADLLERGVPIGTAIYISCGELNLRVPLMLEAAEQTGQLEATLNRIAHPAESGEDNRVLGVAPVQILLLFLTIYLVVSMILIYVMPKFEAIMRDFQIQQPTPMQWLLQVPIDPLVVLSIPVLILLAAVLSRSARGIFTSTRRRAWYSSLLDIILWHTPVLARLTRNQNYADFSWILSGALGAGHTVPQALAVTNRADVNVVFRKKLHKLDACIYSGLDFASAGAVAGMPGLLVSLFKTPGGADLAKALRFAATTYSAKRDRLLIALKAILPTLLTLAFGALIALIAIALFSPMIAIIDGAMPAEIRP